MVRLVEKAGRQSDQSKRPVQSDFQNIDLINTSILDYIYIILFSKDIYIYIYIIFIYHFLFIFLFFIFFVLKFYKPQIFKNRNEKYYPQVKLFSK